MKTITQRVRETYQKSLDKIDRAGISPIYFQGFWFDRAAIEHDQCYVRVQSGVTDETIEECDNNFIKNVYLEAGRNPIKLIIAGIFSTIVKVYTKVT